MPLLQCCAAAVNREVPTVHLIQLAHRYDDQTSASAVAIDCSAPSLISRTRFPLRLPQPSPARRSLISRWFPNCRCRFYCRSGHCACVPLVIQAYCAEMQRPPGQCARVQQKRRRGERAIPECGWPCCTTQQSGFRSSRAATAGRQQTADGSSSSSSRLQKQQQ